MAMQPRKAKEKRKPMMTLTIEFFDDQDYEFNMTQESPVPLAHVEDACTRAVMWVQQEYVKDARFNEQQVEKVEEKEMNNVQ